MNIAFLILVEAAATCSPAPARFAGGAVVVRPVGSAAPLPFKRLGPAPVVAKDKKVKQTGAEAAGKDIPKGKPAPRCEAATHIA